MRQIKFRAWDSVRKVMHLNASKVGESLYWDNGTSYNHMAFIYPKEEGERYFLMQFTGLQDKNGVGIYEGDIISIQYIRKEYTNSVVCWSNDSALFYTSKEVGGEGCAISRSHMEEFEVIGNIHENPELLTDNN